MSAPLPDPLLPFDQQDPLILLAMAIWGESRSEPLAAQLGVGCVVRNRIALQGWMGRNYVEAILCPWQFSAFNPSDLNSKKLLTPLAHDSVTSWETAFLAAYRIYNDIAQDNTFGSIFYFSLPLKVPPKKRDGSPAWGPTDTSIVIGGLTFCRPSKAVPGMPVSA